jgi:hypothetical protein
MQQQHESRHQQTPEIRGQWLVPHPHRWRVWRIMVCYYDFCIVDTDISFQAREVIISQVARIPGPGRALGKIQFRPRLQVMETDTARGRRIVRP